MEVDEPITKFILCSDHIHDINDLEYSPQLISTQTFSLPLHLNEYSSHNMGMSIRWLMTQQPGTMVLVAKDCFYDGIIKLMRDLGWRMVLACPPGVDSYMMSLFDEFVLLPLRFETSLQVFSASPEKMSDYLMNADEEIDMSPLDLKGTYRLIDSFKKTNIRIRNWDQKDEMDLIIEKAISGADEQLVLDFSIVLNKKKENETNTAILLSSHSGDEEEEEKTLKSFEERTAELPEFFKTSDRYYEFSIEVNAEIDSDG